MSSKKSMGLIPPLLAFVSVLFTACEVFGGVGGSSAVDKVQQKPSTNIKVVRPKSEEAIFAPLTRNDSLPKANDATVTWVTPPPVPSATTAPTTASISPGTQVVTGLLPPKNPADLCGSIGSLQRKILILDFKSGWFAGDGGTTFKTFTESTCNRTLTFFYAHITARKLETNLQNTPEGRLLLPCLGDQNVMPVPGTPNSFYDTQSNCSFGSFIGMDELWLLSGSNKDSWDVKNDSPLYANAMMRAKELRDKNPTSSFFFGAGLGNFDHANSMAYALFPELVSETAFSLSSQPASQLGVLPSPLYVQMRAKKPLVAGDGLAVGSIRNTELLFKGVQGLFDYDIAQGENDRFPKCWGDPLTGAKEGLRIIGTDHCGQKMLASGFSGKHQLFFDGNMARFYGTKPEEYFNRIAVQLLP